MLLLCNQNHKEVAFEGTNRELDCPVCKLLEEKAVELSEMEEKGARITIKPRSLTQEGGKGGVVGYGGTPYTSRDEGRPYGGKK